MLEISKISFPGLGIGEFEVNSKAFSLFDASVAWYALIITFGMIVAVAYTVFRAKKIGISFDDVLDMALFAIPIGIIGARLYYVLTKLESYHSFMDVISIWNGGLAIYGGILAGAATVVVICYVKKINFFAFADCCTPGIIMAQSIGRWGNFMNGEAFGSETESFLRMGIRNSVSRYTFGTSEMVYVHPTFLYESLWNLLGFVLINIFYKHKRYDGQIFLMVFGWYGLGRMIIEGMRTDSLWVGPFGIVTLIFGIILIAAIGVILYYLPRIINAFKNKDYTCLNRTVLISAAGSLAVSILMIILDNALIHSVTVIPEQRVSQVLAGIIFTVCTVFLVYFLIRKPDVPLYVKADSAKNTPVK